MQRLPDQQVGDLGTIGIRRVDEGDAEFHSSTEHPHGVLRIGRLAQTPEPGNCITP